MPARGLSHTASDASCHAGVYGAAGSARFTVLASAYVYPGRSAHDALAGAVSSPCGARCVQTLVIELGAQGVGDVLQALRIRDRLITAIGDRKTVLRLGTGGRDACRVQA